MLFSVDQCLEDLPECSNTCWDGSAPDRANSCACPEKPTANWPAVLKDINDGSDFKGLGDKWTDEQQLSDYCDRFADKIYDEWRRIKDIDHTLGKACEDGIACRDGVWDDAKAAMKAECVATVNDIKDLIDVSWTNSKRILEEGYREEYVCDPDCYCEEIEQSYIDHVRLEREIEREIDQIQDDIKNLVQQRKDVLTNCPDYAENFYEVPAGYLD